HPDLLEDVDVDDRRAHLLDRADDGAGVLVEQGAVVATGRRRRGGGGGPGSTGRVVGHQSDLSGHEDSFPGPCKSRCGAPAQGFDLRLHLSNVLKTTKRTSLPPPEWPGRDDSIAWPYRTSINVLQGPENSSARPAPTARTYPGP